MVLLGQTNACDLNLDGRVDSNDVQLAINMSLGLAPCTANIAGATVCNVVVVQRVVNASMGSTCLTGSGLHSVSLTWAASAAANVTGYNVYRATSAAGPYTLVSSVGLATSYTDNTVQSGTVYYYVVAAVDAQSNISPYSNQVQAVIPSP
jgi:hypothetical protein